MHDIRTIRDNPAAFDAALSRRGITGVSSELAEIAYGDELTPMAGDVLKKHSIANLVLAVDQYRRDEIEIVETLRSEQKRISREAGAAKKVGNNNEFEAKRRMSDSLKREMEDSQTRSKDADRRLNDVLVRIPNLPADDVPAGNDEDDNVEIHRYGSVPNFSFDPLEHYDIPGIRPGMDFETAAKLSGSRFVLLSGAVARLHRALAQFMLDLHVEEHGLTETITPVLVREEMMYGTGQLPKFGEDSYQTTNGWWLIPTAEVTLTNIVNGLTIEESYLPRRYVAHTQCFRSEAGSAGRDTSGMLRQHQFEKVEMVSITAPEHSDAEHQRMTKCAEAVLEKLEIPYRTVILCTGDLGAGMRKTHDIEVWLPGQNTYREIASVSVAGDYQARRMNARYKPAEGGKPQFVHTLNGSGLAVGRALIAVVENGQQEDGSVNLPAVLHPYLRGKTRITAEGSLA